MGIGAHVVVPPAGFERMGRKHGVVIYGSHLIPR